MTAWVVDQEREVVRRRTKEGLWARARGNPGRLRPLSERQVQLARRAGRSRMILKVNEKTVWNALKAGPSTWT